MNIAVGKITPEAQQAIEMSGGCVNETLNPQISLAVLPDDAEMVSSSSQYAHISLGDETLVFTRAWSTENCTLDLCK